jgi:hypothetical protein
MVLVVALANKTARIAWAVMHRQENSSAWPQRLRPPGHALELAREQ